MALSYEILFTPMFIMISLAVLIAGIVGIQFLEKLFHGSNNLLSVKIFAISVLINIVIFIFLLMSFRRVKFTHGKAGPTGNRGDRGSDGRDGGLSVCGVQYQKVQDKKQFERQLNYLDLKPPVITP
jgi:hypothetical protein